MFLGTAIAHSNFFSSWGVIEELCGVVVRVLEAWFQILTGDETYTDTISYAKSISVVVRSQWEKRTHVCCSDSLEEGWDKN